MSALPDTIAFLGFGEAAAAFTASLREAAPALRIVAWDIKQEGPEAAGIAQAMAAAGIERADMRAGLADAAWVFSAVTADQSLIALEQFAPSLRQGQLVIDITSVSPRRKQDSARLVASAGGAYLDMAVMAPVHPQGHRTPVLIGGDADGAIRRQLDAFGFRQTHAGDAPGDATAIKMVRSLFVKGLEAITVEALLAAEASGCRDAVVRSLSGSFSGLGWPAFAEYQFERTTTHGARRAAEMRECAETLRELGLGHGLATEIAAVQDAQSAASGRIPPGAPLATILSEVLDARRAARPSILQKRDEVT